MNSSAANHDTDDLLLAEFFADWERRGSVAITEYVQRYPHLAEQIDEFVRLHEAVDETRPGALLPGGRLGDFRILRRVGGGGMGDVYEAIQEHLGRRVALKVIRHGRVSDDARNRFLREQQVLARLHQTHIVPIHFAGEEDNLQYFVMPFIRGAALHDVIDAARRFPAAQPTVSVPPLPVLAELKVQADASNKDRPVRAVGDPSQETPTVRHNPRSTATDGKGQAEDRAPAPAGVPQLVLSRAYFRSVAALMADAAEALEHAHNAVADTDEDGARKSEGVLHRDLKPANIMVDLEGKCWIIDFGLASTLKEGGGAVPGGPAATGPYTVSSVVGTPEYMAPEQLDGKADVRTDVWGLGVTLYELLTLRRPFTAETQSELQRKIREETPEPPGRLVQGMPPDLAAICLKAIQKDPTRRYQTAAEVATDLRRWLAGEPTRARPPGPLRRLGLWANRNRAVAVAVVLGLLTVVTLAVAVVLVAWEEVRRADDRVAAAEQRERDLRRESLRQRLQQIRQGLHFRGWSEEASHLAEEAIRLGPDDDLRDQAADTLRGIDARLESSRWPLASSLAFEPAGQRLLAGGTETIGARLRDEASGVVRISRLCAPGPVTFDANGAPLQLAIDPKDPTSVLLWDVERDAEVRRFSISPPAPEGGGSPMLALAAGGKFVAVTVVDAQGRHLVYIWETTLGKLLEPFEAVGTALAIAPDGTLAAVGREDGSISVWSPATGKVHCDFRPGSSRINCLAFHRDVRWREAGEHPRGVAWVLGSGDAGGNAWVWDLTAKVSRGHCTGAHHRVDLVAFSPDGTTLATAEHGHVRIWEVATGKPLWVDGAGSSVAAMAFSPNGSKLVCSVRAAPSPEPFLLTWELEAGRGIGSLRGLTSEVSRLAFSPDGRSLAALGHGWEVGVWDLPSGQLRCVLEVPQGWTADNAALAFSPDGRRLAYSSGRRACLWDLSKGTIEGSWKLPLGTTDGLMFAPKDRLLLARTEGVDGEWGKAEAHPRVIQLRELLCPGTWKRVNSLRGFERQVLSLVASANGEVFAVDGLGKPGVERHPIVVFHAGTGELVCSVSLVQDSPDGLLALDPGGSVLAYIASDKRDSSLIETRSGKTLDLLERIPMALSPGAEYRAMQPFTPTEGGPRGCELSARLGKNPLVVLGLETPSTQAMRFDAEGKLLAWGNKDGSVMLCDLEAVRKRLGQLGVGWEPSETDGR